MNREKLIENSFRNREILDRLNNREIFWLNLGDLLVPDLTQKIFHKRLAKIEDAVDKERPHVNYYALPLYPYPRERMYEKNSDINQITLDEVKVISDRIDLEENEYNNNLKNQVKNTGSGDENIYDFLYKSCDDFARNNPEVMKELI